MGTVLVLIVHMIYGYYGCILIVFIFFSLSYILSAVN
jgi:hypothetical protein